MLKRQKPFKYNNIGLWLTIGIVGLFLISCNALYGLQQTAVPVEMPTITPPPHEDPRLDLYCAVDDASPVPCGSSIELHVGDTLHLRTHPISIGLIRYTLSSSNADLQITYNPRDASQTAFIDNNPVLDGIVPDTTQSDSVEFVFTAVAEGSTSISINASGEISDFQYYDGQWYPYFNWGAVSSQPLEITVISN